VLDYLEFVAKPQALSEVLDEAPKKIAACVDADVASLYLLEGDGRTMVMRGNVGFPEGARGKVRLSLGEGITGHAVEIQHPVAAERAPDHRSYRAFPELGEERYPAFAAVPIIGPHGPLGAVVVQRAADRPFSDSEVSLVAALTAPISSAIRLARLLDDMRDTPENRAGSGTRKLTLTGVPVVPGRSLGAIAALRRPAISPEREPDADDAERFQASLEVAERALRGLLERAMERGLGGRAEFIQSFLLMVGDQRLRHRSVELLGEGESLASALGKVAREATRAASKQGDAFLVERARDLEQLCDALLMLASPDSRATIPSKAVLLADELGIYDLLITARSQPAGIVLTEREPRERTRVLLELLGVPAVSGVEGAFRWASPGDIALVDADHGLVVINPSRADIAAFRHERSSLRSSPHP
jgi:phosphotransferase system enzyme I (PtsP)